MLYRSTAYPGLRLRSVPRIYQAGVNIVSYGRPDLLYIRIQNRGNQAVYFWHGRIPAGPTGQGLYDLAIEPSEWTVQEAEDAQSLLVDIGERVESNSRWEPTVAHTGLVYSLVVASTNYSHVIIGLQVDQEQGVDSHSENGT